LQTADSRCRERQNRNWVTRLNEPSVSALPTNRPRNDVPPPRAIICAAFPTGRSIGEDFSRWHLCLLAEARL
jgi:hypothetical protein